MADENETGYRFDTKRIHSSYDPRSDRVEKVGVSEKSLRANE
jgi:hypothetical protein